MNARRKLWVKVMVVVAPVLMIFGVAWGCGSGDRPPVSGGGVTDPSLERCVDGQTRACYELLGQTAGIRTCFVGTQSCKGEAWGPCSGGGSENSIVVSAAHAELATPSLHESFTAPRGGMIKQLAISTPSADASGCNPCDPSCIGWDECGPFGAGPADAGPTVYFAPTALPACAIPAISGNGPPPGGNVPASGSCDCTGAGSTCSGFCGSGQTCDFYSRPGKTAYFHCQGYGGPFTNTCNIRCESGSTCYISSQDVNNVNIECAPGATCIWGTAAEGHGCHGVNNCTVTCPTHPTPACMPGSALAGGSGYNGVLWTAGPYVPPVDGGGGGDGGGGDGGGGGGGAGCTGLVSVPGPANITNFPGKTGSLLYQDKGGGCGSSSYNHRCQHYPHDPTPTFYTLDHSACQGDTFCNHVSECCELWGPGGRYPAGECAGVDFTIGRACAVGNQDYFQICNRGNTAAAAGAVIGIAVQTPGAVNLPQATDMPDAGANCGPTKTAGVTCYDGCVNLTATCEVTLPTALGPGQCQTHTCGKIPGNKYIVVNTLKLDGGAREPECTFNTIPDGFYGFGEPSPRLEPGCANNWSSVNGAPQCTTTFPPITVTHNYPAVCPTGTRVLWNRLGWTSSVPTTPAGANIVFRARTRSFTPDGGPGAWSTWVTVATVQDDPAGDPEQCNICKALDAALGPSDSRADELELEITVNPATPATAIAELYNWQVTYSCPAAE